MSFALQPWQLLVMILAGWVNRRQQAVIEYLRTEKQVLKEKLGKRRILLDDDQRQRLGVKGKVLGRKILGERSVRPCESTMPHFRLSLFTWRSEPGEQVSACIGQLTRRFQRREMADTL